MRDSIQIKIKHQRRVPYKDVSYIKKYAYTSEIQQPPRRKVCRTRSDIKSKSNFKKKSCVC